MKVELGTIPYKHLEVKAYLPQDQMYRVEVADGQELVVDLFVGGFMTFQSRPEYLVGKTVKVDGITRNLYYAVNPRLLEK
jgi:hypothetical protein